MATPLLSNQSRNIYRVYHNIFIGLNFVGQQIIFGQKDIFISMTTVASCGLCSPKLSGVGRSINPRWQRVEIGQQVVAIIGKGVRVDGYVA